MIAGTPEMELVKFSPGGVLCLKHDEGDDNSWTVQWMVIPDILR